MFEILKNTLRLPATLLAIGVAVFIALSSNMALWQVIAGLPVDKNTAWLMKSVVFLLVTLVLSVLMLLLPGRAFIKPVAIILLFLTAIIGYFQAEMGVTFHPEMIRNIVNNIQDQNTNEALELISLPLLQHLLWFFLLPAAIVALLPVSRQGIIRESIDSPALPHWLLCSVFCSSLTSKLSWTVAASTETCALMSTRFTRLAH